MLNNAANTTWFASYTAAMLGTNAQNKLERIAVAERALRDRIAEITIDSPAMNRERREIDYALKHLQLLSKYPAL